MIVRKVGEKGGALQILLDHYKHDVEILSGLTMQNCCHFWEVEALGDTDGGGKRWNCKTVSSHVCVHRS